MNQCDNSSISSQWVIRMWHCLLYEVASGRGIFFNYEDAPRSLFFLNVNGGMRAKWRKKRMRRLQETTQDREHLPSSPLAPPPNRIQTISRRVNWWLPRTGQTLLPHEVSRFSGDFGITNAMRRSIHCPQHLSLLILHSSVLNMALTSLDLGDIFLAVMSTQSSRSVTFRKAQRESPPSILPPRSEDDDVVREILTLNKLKGCSSISGDTYKPIRLPVPQFLVEPAAAQPHPSR
jgi:hypothetical protein